MLQILKHWLRPKLDTYYVYSFVPNTKIVRADTLQLPRRGGQRRYYEAAEFFDMCYAKFWWDDSVDVFIKYDKDSIRDKDFASVSHHLENHLRLIGPIPYNLPILPESRLLVHASLPHTSIAQSELISIPELASLVNPKK